MRFSRSHLKRAYFTIMAGLGRDANLLKKIRGRDHLLILNFHRISPHPNPFWSPLHPRVFERLLGFLREHFEIVRFGDLHSATPDRPAAVISFDDAYYDFVEYAMPLLDRYGLRVNQNVIPDCIDSGRPPWNVRLSDFLNVAPRRLINELSLPGFTRRLDGDDDDSKTRFGVALSGFLKSRPRKERQELWPAIDALIARCDEPSGTRMMTVEEVRQAATRHEIGAHSCSHESMAYEPLDFFEQDFERCAAYFQDRLRLPLTVYAFPNGSYRREQIQMLQQRGVRHILLVDERFAKRDSDVCPRFTMYGDSYQELKFRSLGYFTGKGAALMESES